MSEQYPLWNISRVLTILTLWSIYPWQSVHVALLTTSKTETLSDAHENMIITNLTGEMEQTFVQILCTARLTGGLHYQLTFLSVINIVLSIAAILGNTLTLAALQRESSLHPPSKLLFCCVATTDLCSGLIAEPMTVVFWMAVINEHWKICEYTLTSVITCYILISVSLWTLTAISVDRLLALLLGLRYRQVVTLKRTLLIVIIFRLGNTIGTTLFFLDYRITFWGGYASITLCLTTSIASYIEIFLTLRRQTTQVHNHGQQEPNQALSFDVTRYRKAVYSALWLQLKLALCFLPHGELSPTIFLARQCTVTLVFF